MHIHMQDVRGVINESPNAPRKVNAAFDLGNQDVNRKLSQHYFKDWRDQMRTGTWTLRAYWQFSSSLLTLALISQSTSTYTGVTG